MTSCKVRFSFPVGKYLSFPLGSFGEKPLYGEVSTLFSFLVVDRTTKNSVSTKTKWLKKIAVKRSQSSAGAMLVTWEVDLASLQVEASSTTT